MNNGSLINKNVVKFKHEFFVVRSSPFNIKINQELFSMSMIQRIAFNKIRNNTTSVNDVNGLNDS